MTPSQIEQMARERYNAVGETFWSQSELFSLIYAAEMELATKTLCIERTFSATTVSGTAEYAIPSNTLSIRRVTYNGLRIDPVDGTEGESIELGNSTVVISGLPIGYERWNDTIILHPAPNDAQTLKVYTFGLPQSVTSTSTLEVPDFTHTRIVNYVVSEMYAKDKDFGSAKYYREIWTTVDIPEILRAIKKRRRADRMAHVKDEESLPRSYIG